MVTDHTFFIDEFDSDEADLIFDHLRKSTAPSSAAHIRVLGGAMARVPVDATAFAHRQRKMLVNAAALYEDAGETAEHARWARDFGLALQQGSSGGYINFMGTDGEARIREAYPGGTWDRLVEIKTRYDPENLFQLNQNIPPKKENSHDGKR